MSSIGTGYDLSVSTYSPDGRIFQVEYSHKAVDNAGTTIGLRVKDGVVLATEKLITSKLLLNNKRIQSASDHIGVAFSGLLADGRHFINRAKEEANQYQDIYRRSVPGQMISDRMGQYVQAFTLYSSVRPFGISAIMGLWDEYKGPQLYMVEPSGIYYEYYGCACGKGRQIAKTEIEKMNLNEMGVEEAVKQAAKIIALAHDESKDREYELEITWICEASGFKHRFVPAEVLEAAKKFAEDSLNEDEMQE